MLILITYIIPNYTHQCKIINYTLRLITTTSFIDCSIMFYIIFNKKNINIIKQKNLDNLFKNYPGLINKHNHSKKHYNVVFAPQLGHLVSLTDILEPQYAQYV